MDDGFSYRVPDDLAGSVGVGSLVRVPLAGRRVRGYVVGLREGDREGLKEIIGVSGEIPVFHRMLLETLRWTAVHYVAPLAVVLGKPAPPTIPRLPDPEPAAPAPVAGAGPPSVPEVVEAALAGRHTRSRYLVGPGPWGRDVGGSVAPVVEAGRSALVIGPTLSEVERMRAFLEESLPGSVVMASSDRSGREETAAWVRACSRPGTVVVGTRSAAFWPVAGLALAVVMEEGRRGMKDKQTPTTHVREILAHRSRVERFPLLYLGRVPTTEVLAAGIEVVQPRGRSRAWPLVEVVDRWEDPPGTGILTDRVRTALRLLVRDGGRAFVFTHRRGYAPAARCTACRTLRRCPSCGARPDPGEACRRCGTVLGPCPSCGGARFEPLGAGVGRVVEELRRSVPEGAVGESGSGALVEVGTERDLVSVEAVDLAVAVDADGLILAPDYRAQEDALRILARLAGTVASGRGRRAMIQTTQPHHPVVTALRRGDPLACLEQELEARTRTGLPPAGQVLVVEVTGGDPEVDPDLRELVGERASVLGPLTGPREASRWLIQGGDLRGVKVGLRPFLQRLRDQGARIHVDADPLDL